jgi:hypothetical protein
MEAEVTEMIAIPIPPMEPFVSGGGSVWAGVVAAAILIVVLAASAWANLRNRNVHADPPHHEAEAAPGSLSTRASGLVIWAIRSMPELLLSKEGPYRRVCSFRS